MTKNKMLGILLCLLGITIIIGTIIITNSSYAISETTGIKVRFYNLDETDNETSSVNDSKFVLVDKENKEPIKYFSLGINKGYIEFDDIKPGSYILKNYETPDNYAIGKDMEINIEDNKEIQNFQYLNTKSENKKVLIYVQDTSTNELIKDNVLEIRNEEDEVIDKCTTNNLTPCIFQNLSNGNYKIVETKIPTGYLNNEIKTFSLNESDNGKTIIINYKKDFTKVAINVIDANTSKKLSGIKLEIYDFKNHLVDSFITENDAHIVEKLPIGKYYIKEVSTIDGYILNDNKQTFEVVNTKEIINIKIENQQNLKEGKIKNEVYLYLGFLILLSGIFIILFLSKKTKKKKGNK